MRFSYKIVFRRLHNHQVSPDSARQRVARPRGSPRNLLKRKPPPTQEHPLLSRGSQVRVLPGAPIFSDSFEKSQDWHPSRSVTLLRSPSFSAWQTAWQ